MRARELMTRNLVVVAPETPVAAITELLAARGISAVPVIEAEGRPIGLVTEGDLIRRLAEAPRGPIGWFLDMFRDPKPLVARFAKAHGATARDVMTADLVTVDEEASAEAIAQAMEKHNIRRVPVLRDGVLVGIVSRADLLRAVLRDVEAPSLEATDQDITGPRDDRALLQAVIAAMREQPWTDTFWVYPQVEAGVVTLYGYARSEALRNGLRLLAQDIPGVVRVEDALQPMPLILRAAL